MERRLDTSELNTLDRIYRLNLINGLSGYKPANLIGTKSADGHSNLSIVSSVIHLSSSPAIMGFIQRPTSVPRHTYSNISETGFFTINQVNEKNIAQAHYTSAKFNREESEFDKCDLTEEYKDGFFAPFVKECNLKISLKFTDEYQIKASNTILIVGAVESIYLPDNVLAEDGQIDINSLNAVCVSGLNNYHVARQIASFSYAKPGQYPQNKFT